MNTKLTWQTGTPTKTTNVLAVVRSDTEEPFFAIAEYDHKLELWFERGGFNMDLGDYEIVRWTDLAQIKKLLKE